MSSLCGPGLGHANPNKNRQLTRRECREWLVSHHEGRLGYQTGRGARSVVVSYAMAGEQIMFHLPDYNEIVHYAPGETITLDVDGRAATAAEFETVMVTGKAELADITQTPGISEAKFDEQWPEGVRTSVLYLSMTDVEGFESDN